MIIKPVLLLAGSLLALTSATTTPRSEAAGKPADAAVGQTAALAADRPQIGSFGFDTAGMDRTVAPGDDFYAFSNGNWEKTTPIPADRANYGAFAALEELSMARTRGILDEAVRDPASKLGALYASFMNENAIEAKGFGPIKGEIAAIKGIGGKSDYARALGIALRNGIRGPVAAAVSLDNKNPDRPTIRVVQAGLGLPDRDYYLKTDAPMAAARKAYVDYLTQLLTLTGERDAAARAAAVVDFETNLAKVHWTRIANRDSDKTYNVWTRADFERQAPGFDWAAYLAAAGLANDDHYIVAQPTAVAASVKLIAGAPMAVLRDYLLVRTIDDAAPWLSRRFVEANFAFHGTTLSGTPQIQLRWKRGVDLVKSALGEDLGQAYVKTYFPPATKAAADQLVRDIIAAMDRRLQALAWMDPAAILQPPFFDPKADPAVNYGGIGAVIGHEISHHFDDQGRKYDKTGRLAAWWTPQDVARFTALTDRLVKEYDAYEPLPGMHVQGALTLGENMADLAGLTVALDAYHASLDGRPAPLIDGLTGDQRFYLGWAQVWRRSYREANLRQRLLTDPHSPSVQRTWIVRNLAPWYDAYKPAPTAKMYLAPDQRVLVW